MSYVVAVRALCEFTAKVGDLDLRFTPSPTAQEGIAGHRRVTARRGQGYQAEVPRVAELFDAHFLFDVSKREGTGKRHLSTLCLRNVVPAPLIGPRLASARSTVMFSATLSPRHYYADLLGLPAQWSQSRQMGEQQRREFLARFTPDSQGVGFAVLGGAFGEGIDLPGARLIGAFIATLGLAQLNPVNEQLKQRMGAIFGDGYDYTYLYPGVQKVVQAAGRVIRCQHDRGVVVLIDERFGQAKVQQLFPTWWQCPSAFLAGQG
ncbi:hypothetical protein NVV94_12360 [Pseudomonas sp. LS1212]|nr:helicase C-terminal domain-containing protein [Pseudomonas sp. LS1212]UVJ46254.1 hypothetical protein NVV94_12360 [Pseudomonas sp. LS1212]